MSFNELKKSRANSLSRLNSELEKLNTGFQKKTDERFWEPTVDKAKNGYAVIRFLPAPPKEDVPFIRRYDHGFKGPTGKWYIEMSRSTIGDEDPVSDMNRKLWEEGENSRGRKIVSGTPDMPGTKRRMHYISNVLVITDPGNPDNEGKVFLYKFGKKIFDKLNDAMNPKFEDEKPINPFDFWEGANFKIKIRNVESYRNYDKSEFSDPSPVSDDDAVIERIWNQEHSLQAFLDPKEFKSYDELEKKLKKVMAESDDREDRREKAEEPEERRQVERSLPVEENKSESPKREEKVTSADDDEDDFFAQLASGKK
jgi:hypothetical protein